ncbi:hypothetical protein MCEMRE217_00498 [Candidatus Nanopelagicaceae bacterium]
MRKHLRLVALIIPMVLVASNSYAAVKAGSACPKLKMISVSGGKVYTCTKSGKKLVWDKGVLVPVAKPAPGVSASAVPAPSPSATTKSVDIAIPTSIADLFEKRKGIAYSVWSKFNKAVSQPDVTLPPIEIYRGPNTPTYVKDPNSYFKQVVQLFPGVALPKKFVVFYWNQKDLAEVTKMALSIMGAQNIQKNIDETTGPFVRCNNDTNCDVGGALIGTDGTAYIGIGLADTQAEAESTGGGNGGVEKVEFYHALQLFNYHTNSLPIFSQGQNLQSANLPPFWLNIGGENLVSNGLASAKNYERSRQMSGYKNWADQIIPGFNEDWINEYLDIKNVNTRWKDSSYLSYRPHVLMGSYLSEIFMAIKGPSVLLDIHERMSKKASFTDAFQGIFGVSWEQAKPELVKVIYDRYLYNY